MLDIQQHFERKKRSESKTSGERIDKNWKIKTIRTTVFQISQYRKTLVTFDTKNVTNGNVTRFVFQIPTRVWNCKKVKEKIDIFCCFCFTFTFGFVHCFSSKCTSPQPQSSHSSTLEGSKNSPKKVDQNCFALFLLKVIRTKKKKYIYGQYSCCVFVTFTLGFMNCSTCESISSLPQSLHSWTS